MNREFIDKMKEAKKLEVEAFKMLLPENMRGHVQVIEKEMKAIFVECITDCFLDNDESGKDKEAAYRKVQKVEID